MNKLFVITRLGAVLVLLLAYATQPALTRPALAAADSLIYADALADGWYDWSWPAPQIFDNPQPVHSGSASIAVTYTTAWAGLYLHTDTAVPASDYTAIRFWVHGGSAGGQTVNFHFNDGGDNYYFTVPANVWLQVTIPLAALGNPATLSEPVWQDYSGDDQPTFYLDDISLVGTPPFKGWLVLDGGTDTYALAPFQSELDLRGGSFTVEMWIKLDDAVISTSDYDVYPLRQQSSFKFLIHKTTSPPPTFITRHCNHFVLYPNSGSCWWIGDDRGTFLGIRWGHLAGVYDKDKGESVLFWNGQIMERVTTAQSTDTPGELSINHWQGAWSNLLGLADEARISDTVRYSDSFSPPTVPFVCDANTRALWHFDELEGSTVFHDACGAQDNILTGYNGAHTAGVSVAPLTAVTIDGPITGTTGVSYTFAAVVNPISATTPITYTWSPAPDSGQNTSSAAYMWSTYGDKAITVTAQNIGEAVSDTHTVTIGRPNPIYMPLIQH